MPKKDRPTRSPCVRPELRCDDDGGGKLPVAQNPQDDRASHLWWVAGLGTLAVAAGTFLWFRSIAHAAQSEARPSGEPRAGGQDVPMGAFDLYAEEADASGQRQPAQTVMLVWESRSRPGRWFVNLPNGEAGWADVPPV